MNSIFLGQLAHYFGINYIDDPIVEESLHQNDDINRPIAEIGDSILNLTVKTIAYCKLKDPIYIDNMRQKFANNYANQKILNQDVIFTRFLKKNGFTQSPESGIGLEKADRFVEGIIGAVFISKGFTAAKETTIKLLKTNKEFIQEFPHISSE